MIKIKRIDPNAEAEAGTPKGILSGNPVTATANQYTGGDERFFCGVWTSTPGCWKISYTEEEFCVLLSGRARLTDADGTVTEFGPGDAFVIPSGFEGQWETLEPLKKLYAILER
ncbi:cupin domain-containing protein [Lacibacterium aquatile]|uniref:Cupin domain-containing protein n=1 Tax=Lacibacterium aquatile TaxID=1168082 RepID=A0ABW5DLT8_9PROT